LAVAKDEEKKLDHEEEYYDEEDEGEDTRDESRNKTIISESLIEKET
jgi:hypothetical protein